MENLWAVIAVCFRTWYTYSSGLFIYLLLLNFICTVRFYTMFSQFIYSIASVCPLSVSRGATGARQTEGVTWKVSTSPHFSWTLTEQKGAEGEAESTREREKRSRVCSWQLFQQPVSLAVFSFLRYDFDESDPIFNLMWEITAVWKEKSKQYKQGCFIFVPFFPFLRLLFFSFLSFFYIFSSDCE